MSNSERLENILNGASELPPEQRAAYLNAACGADAELRADVDSLLRSLDEAGRFLSAPTDGAPAAETLAAPLREGPGTRIGPYKILQLIGEGGFGSVFMAEQEKPVSRKVALKIIKLGMDTKAVIARFEAERQALAMMDHPNIARVLDAGATDTGRPFFVMELVKGAPVVEYCDKNNLAIQDRLVLFAQACNAIQHAHTKGIIHRDIKPSNILVSTQDGRPHTKVIDFGIAKATSSRLTERTLFTEHRALIGTPEYMSPEQAEGSLDIDTRTDVYSLGVLLYELLTGTTPFSGKELRSAAYAEVQRIIREVEPPKPSTRISHNTDTLASVAAKRHTEPKRLGTAVRGELDWIVMKALEKDRQRRYETASGLAMDIQRYLAGEAVVAAPPGRVYRVRKFIRRHRTMVGAASVVMIVLMLGIAGTTAGLVSAERQRRAAVSARADEAAQHAAADAQRDRALAAQASATASEQAAQQARTSAEGNARLAEIQATLALGTIQRLVELAQSQLEAPGASAFQKSVLDLALANISQVSENYQKSTSKEATTAAIHNQLGRLFVRLGQSDKALEQFQSALEITQERVKIKQGSDPSRQNLAHVHIALADVRMSVKRDMKAVLDHNLEALRLYQDIYDHPKDDGFKVDHNVVTVGLAEARQRVGVTLYRLGDLAGAAGHFRAALDLREQMLGQAPGDANLRHEITFSCLAMADASFRLNENGEALRLYERCLEIRKSLAAASPASTTARSELADSYYMLGQFEVRTGDLERAFENLDRSRQIRQELVNSDPKMVEWQRGLGLSLYWLGGLAERRGDTQSAAAAFSGARAICEQLAKGDSANERRQIELMVVLAHVGDVAAATAIADRLAGGADVDNELRTDLARCYAQCARATLTPEPETSRRLRTRAMGVLRDAIQNGYSDRVCLATEPDLQPLADDPEFVSLLSGMERKK